MNIAEKLKFCPQDTRLYCTIYGNCLFKGISSSGIWLFVENNNIFTPHVINLYPDGSFNNHGECVLFPSKENRDWSTFLTPFKDGDIIILDTPNAEHLFRNIAIFKSYREDKYHKMIIYGQIDGKKNILAHESVVHHENWRLANEEEVNNFLNILANKGYVLQNNKMYKKFNTIDLNPFDKVLIRTEDGHWYPTLVSYVDSSGHVYTICSENAQKYILPFEGNENLIGTSDYPDGLFIY